MSFYWILWASWACHQPLTFFVFITLGLPRPIFTFPHHILPMICFFSLSGSFKLIYLFKTHLFVSWTCDPLFLPLGLNGFSIHLPTPFCLCCWASPFYLGFRNGHQHSTNNFSFSEFWVWLATMCYFFYYTSTNMSALKVVINVIINPFYFERLDSQLSKKSNFFFF